MKVSEILKTARARLTPDTWGKGNGTNDEGALAGRLCALMSIRGVDGCSDEAIQAAVLLAQTATGVFVQRSVYRWNDDASRTLQDVLDAFDAAIAIAEQQEQRPVPDPVPSGETKAAR